MNQSKNVHTYGAFASSIKYEECLKKRNWFKRNKTRLAGVAAALTLIGSAVAVFITNL